MATKKSCFTESQIVAVVKEAEAGWPSPSLAIAGPLHGEENRGEHERPWIEQREYDAAKVRRFREAEGQWIVPWAEMMRKVVAA